MLDVMRRTILKMTALALPASWISSMDALAATNDSPANTASLDEWTRFNRTLIAEAYNPPFYPSLDYEPSRAVRIAQELNCDSMRYPAASYYAYFPTQSGYPTHPALQGDPMRESLKLLREAGLRTIAYVPLNHPFMSIESKDPRYADWCKRFIDGSPMITSHYGFQRFYEGCLNSPIHEVATKLTMEVVDYDFDVLYFDGPYQGMNHAADFCHCKHCHAAYNKRFGIPIPDQKTCSLSEYLQYYTWMRDEVVLAFFTRLREMIRERRDVPVLFNDTSLLSRREWRARAIPITDGFMFEAAETPEEKLFNLQLGKSTGKIIWTYLGSHTEYNREHLKNKAVRGWFSYPLEEQEIFIDGATATAAGAGCVYWGLSRFFYQPEPPLNYDEGRYVKEIFTFQQKHAQVLRGLSSRPQVGILVGSQTIDWYNGSKFVRGAYANYYHGAFDLLKALSIESEPFLDWRMKPELLARYSMIYAPNTACLSDEQCALLRRYVESGGVLVATHLTSIADEHGRVRDHFGLGDVFGASFLQAEPFEYPDLYLNPLHGALITQDPQVMLIKADAGTVEAITHDRGNRRDLGPAVVTNSVGKGSCIYIASGLEAVFEETRMVSVRAYLASLLLPRLETERTYHLGYISGVTPHYMASEKHIVLHLLADVGDENLQPRSRERLSSIQNIKVRIRTPGRVKTVTLMRAGTEALFQQDGEWITVHVPRVWVYEAIHVDLA